MAAKPVYLSYPVTPEWSERVRDQLTKSGRGAQAKLLRYLAEDKRLKVSSSILAETLNGGRQTSELVEPIHRYFGWEPPLPPTAALDAGEVIHGITRLTKAQRTEILAMIDVVEGKSGPQAQKTLQEMMKLFKSQQAKNS